MTERPGLTLFGFLVMVALGLAYWVPILVVSLLVYRYIEGRRGGPGLAARVGKKAREVREAIDQKKAAVAAKKAAKNGQHPATDEDAAA